MADTPDQPPQNWYDSLPRQPGSTPDTEYVQSPATGRWVEVPKVRAAWQLPPPAPTAPTDQPGALSRFVSEAGSQISPRQALHENLVAQGGRALERYLQGQQERPTLIGSAVESAVQAHPLIAAAVGAMADRSSLGPLAETPDQQAARQAQDNAPSPGFVQSVKDIARTSWQHPGLMTGALIQGMAEQPELLAPVGALAGGAAGLRIAKALQAGESGARAAAALGRVAGDATSFGGLMAGTEALRQYGDTGTVDPSSVATQAAVGAATGPPLGLLLGKLTGRPTLRASLDELKAGLNKPPPEAPAEAAAGLGGPEAPSGAPAGGAAPEAPAATLSELMRRAREAGVPAEEYQAVASDRLRRNISDEQARGAMQGLIDKYAEPAATAAEEAPAAEPQAEPAKLSEKPEVEQQASTEAAEKAPTEQPVTAEKLSTTVAEPEAKEPGKTLAVVPPQGEAQPKPAESGPAPKLEPDERGHVTTTVAGQPVTVNVEPTELQKAAGNFLHGHLEIHGIPISIENPAGTTRKSKDPDHPWESTLTHDYGYLPGTAAKDGDHLDAFVGPNPQSDHVYVIDQHQPNGGSYDEGKVMLGFDSRQAALDGYNSNYPKGWDGAKAVTPMSIDQFKTWIKEGNTRAPAKGQELSTPEPKAPTVASYTTTAEAPAPKAEPAGITGANEKPPAQVAPAPATGGLSEPESRALEELKGQLATRALKAHEARAIYAKHVNGGETLNGLQRKRAEEVTEQAVVHRARELASTHAEPHAAYDQMVELYKRQPTFGTRTSTSVQQQAYSTPAPLAYLASQLAGIGPKTKVLEPTAGNGMLLMAATPKNATVNELNPQRAAALRHQGFDVTEQDASRADFGKSVDAVIANPPFGTVKDEAGASQTFSPQVPSGKPIQTHEIDHAIALHALNSMKDDGRAVLIIGGPNKLAKSDEARSDAYNGLAKRKFFYHLHQNYNVTHHFTVNGDLYAKQGAAWPVDVIRIAGKGQSAKALPAVDVPRVYNSWEELKPLLEAAHEQPGSVEPSAGERRPTDLQHPDKREPESGHGPVSEPAVRESAGDDQSLRATESSGETAPAVARGGGATERTVEPGPGGRSEPSGVEQPERATPVEAARPPETAEPETGGAVGGEEATHIGSGEPAAPPRELGERARRDALTEGLQQSYKPASAGPAMDTLVPTNMRDAIADSLDILKGQVGSLDAYVAQELGYERAELPKYFAAEQVDALALALHQMDTDKGFIIGDQTGIGKGRVVAAVIRWAIKKGRTPIFVTEKKKLYGDMYRDLTDIGQQDIRPIMTDADEKVPLDDAGNVMLKTPAAGRHNAELQRMADTADLGGSNMIFTTYTQMQTLKGALTPRMRFLQAFAPNAVVILDEAHNAGGTDAGRSDRKRGVEVGEKIGRAGFARQLARLAKGVFYSSATYAKRPSVMDLYFKTDMSLAVEGDAQKLPAAISAGGVPLQQVVASMLSKAGQYIRRERSFDGVEYNTPSTKVDRRAAEAIASVMLAVKEFDDLKQSIVKGMDKQLKADARKVTGDRSTGGAGAESTQFSSIMHNLIDQMLLSLKADSAADRAIEALKRGEKPVITLANTMGSFIEDYAEAADLKSGDAVALNFGNLMMKYLERSRQISLKGPSGGSPLRRRLTDEEMGSVGMAKYEQVKKLIEQSNLGDTPVSPIDWIHHRLQQAGYKSGEITGRTQTLRYQKDGHPTYRLRPFKETSVIGQRATITAFNNGSLDAMVLNQAGSTGLSLHASEKFKDQRRRRMIIAQPEKNIDTHMQMLGRIHRTGQVVAPAYDQLVADIPAEKRPAAVLAKKMASLNANTTGGRSSQFSAKDTLDFVNQYGDEAAASLMEDMPEVHERLGDPLKKDEEGLVREEAARKVTGRIPMLPVAEQEAFYDMLAESYQELLDRANALGENALEAKTLPLDAKEVSSTELFAGKPGSTSPFAQGAYARTMDVKRLGKPFTSQQVAERLAQRLGQPADTPLRQLQVAARDQWQEKVNETRAKFEEYMTRAIAALSESNLGEEAQQGRVAMLQQQAALWNVTARELIPGQTYAIRTPEGSTYYALLQRIERKKGVQFPVARGSWVAHFDVADGMREITFPFSKIALDSAVGAVGKVQVERAWKHDLTGEPIMGLFDSGQTASREQRTIVTGNLLAGFSKVGRGLITNFTDEHGAIQQGVLMPRSFNLKDFAEDQPVELKADQAERFLQDTQQAILRTGDSIATIRHFGSLYEIQTPRSRAEGGPYFMSEPLRAVVGDFSSRGQVMRATFEPDKLPDVLRVLREDLGQRLYTDTFKEEAQKAGGTVLGGGTAKAAALARTGAPTAAPATGEAGRYLERAKAALTDHVPVDIHPDVASLGTALGRDVPSDVAGAYEPGANKLHFVQSNIPDAAAAQRILRHEAIGHMALERSPEFAKALDMAQRLHDAGGLKRLWNEVARKYPDATPLEQQKEVLAFMAERGLDNSIMQRAKEGVLSLLKKLGIETRPTEAELRSIIVQAARTLPPEAQRLAGMGGGGPPTSVDEQSPAAAGGEPPILFRRTGSDEEPEKRGAYELARRAVVAIPQSEMVMSIRRLVDPTNISTESKGTALIMRSELGKLAHDTERARAELEKYAGQIDQLSPKDQLASIHAIETGAPQSIQALQPMADAMRELLDLWREMVQSLGVGALDNFIENYFPHIWQNPQAAAKLMGMIMGHRPLKGPATFLKKRTIPTIKDGMDLGLRPLSTNPLILAFTKIREMQRFYTGVKIMQRLKDSGLAKFLKAGQSIPPGWQEISDAVGRVRQWSEEEKGFIERGRYIMPEDAARIVNNHLSASWLQRFAPAQVFRAATNMLSAMQLGISGFHLGFTTLDSMISKAALGIERLVHGEPVRAAKAFLEVASGPVGVGMNLRRGMQLLNAYSNAGKATPLQQAIVRALEAGGGRVKMDEYYMAALGASPFQGTSPWSLPRDLAAAMRSSNNRLGAVAKVLGHFPIAYATRLMRDLQSMAVAFPAWQLPFEVAGRVVRAATSVIMEKIVPLQKLGVFSDMAADYLRRNPNASDTELAEHMQGTWASVDNRLGELVYDNLFWNRTFRDILHLGVRAVGWNFGTFREIGGAPFDVLKMVDKMAKSGKVSADDVGHKIPYVIAMVGITMLLGAITMYLMTGKGPEKPKDYFFPQTGGITPYGTPARLSLPSYVKDIYEYGQEPGTTLMNKANPMFSVIGALAKNEDFKGQSIYDPSGPLSENAKDVGRYLLQEATPFSMQNRQQIAGPKDTGAVAAAKKALPYVGVTAAPGRITSMEQIDRARRFRKGQQYLEGLKTRLQQAEQDRDRQKITEILRAQAQKRVEMRDLYRQVEQDRRRRAAATIQLRQQPPP